MNSSTRSMPDWWGEVGEVEVSEVEREAVQRRFVLRA